MTLTAKFKKDLSTLRAASNGEIFLDVKNPNLPDEVHIDPDQLLEEYRKANLEVEQIQQRLNMFNIQVAYNPFFVMEGEIVKNIENHEMVLIGGEYQELTNDLIQLHTKLKKVLVNVYTMSSFFINFQIRPLH